MNNNNKWKRIGSGILAVCLMVILLLSNQSFGVFAEEDGADDIQVQENQMEENSEGEVSENEVVDAEENNQFDDGENSIEDNVEEIQEKSGGIAEEKDQQVNDVLQEFSSQNFTETEDVESDTSEEKNIKTLYIDKGNITFRKDYVSGYIKDINENYKLSNIAYDERTLYVVTQIDATQKTTNHIEFDGEQTNPYHVVIKDVYMGRSNRQAIESNTTGGDNSLEGMIYIPAEIHTKKVYLYFAGKNILNGIRYYTGDEYNKYPINSESFLKIDSASRIGMDEGKLYIPEEVKRDEISNFISESNYAYNRWNSAIGGTDENSVVTGLTIAGGDYQILSTAADNCSTIGGGGNGRAEIDITGGNIYVVCNGTGAAIGGGIGYTKYGGEAHVNISGGTIYAMNYGKMVSNGLTVGGVAIGGGSSFRANGSSATINITGGDVAAYAAYGNGIGSGNSAQASSDQSDIQISGGVVKTNAIGGGSSESATGGSAVIKIDGGSTICEYLNDNYIGAYGIGGGFSKQGNGGNADVTVTGGALDCGSGTIGGGTSRAGGNGGNANISVSKGELYAGKIGGGNAEDTSGLYNGGDASIYVSGGTLDCASIGGGNSVSGMPGSVTSNSKAAGVVVTGGTLKTGTIGGGTNKSGEIGFATADVSGGNIQGQFILSNTDQSRNCFFNMTGGTIDNKDLGSGKYLKAQSNGGAVYLTDENGNVHISGGIIQNATAERGGAVYMTKGSFTLSGDATIQNCTANGNSDNNTTAQGGAVYLDDGTVTMTGGCILSSNAVQGGAIYLKNGTVTLSGGTIGKENSANKANKGAGVYLAGGTLNVFGGIITANTAYGDGGGAYLAGGALTVESGAFNGNTASGNGGGAYLAGGTLTIKSGSFGNNTAQNGGGAYAADGKVRMFGGYITNNTARQSGGGFYVSSDQMPADVVIRSGTISSNKAGGTSVQGNGGAIAVAGNGTTANEDHVEIGLRHQHPDLDMTTRTFTSFNYTDSIDRTQHIHESCPMIEDNEATGNGGGIYMASSESTLDIYCLLEDNNKADADATGGSIMSVGGNVNIGDVGDDGNGNNTLNAIGNILIKSKMLVKGGAVKLYGNTDNPGFSDQILVDIQKNAGDFEDYRFTQITGAVNYKIEYFENFFGSGMFTAIQYEENDMISSMGSMYVHEGYKIIGWATKADATQPTYTIGEIIGNKDEHSAWDNLGTTGALKLYAIWQKISYIVEYHVNVNEGQYSGKMDSDTFTYGEEKALTSNAYKVKGKRFLNWNTESNGTGTSYEETYNESKIISKDGDTVKLYAQWVDCTHHGGAHDGILSYSLNTNGDTITETCDCGNYSGTLKIGGADVYYDGAPHPATLTGTLYATIPQISYSYNETSTESYGNMPEGETIPTKAGYYKASITVGEKTASVEYQIKSAASAATIDVIAKKGQHFTDMSGDSNSTVAQDDAFTVQYQVQALNKGVNDDSKKGYVTAPVLTLNQKLPAGTTIIMQTGGGYWYNSNPSGTEIMLNSFRKMGGTDAEVFTYDTSSIADVQNYRFIIDFSKVENEAYIAAAQKVEIGLKYAYTNPQTGHQETQQDKEAKATITMDLKADFGVTVSPDKRNQVTVTAPSNREDTRWNQKNLVWKIKAEGSAEKLPSDAKLTFTTEENGDIKTAVSYLNQNGEFVIPFEWTNNKEFTFSLVSDQESVADKTYTLTAALYVGSESQEASYPLAGEDNLQKASDSVALTIPISKEPSLKISSTQKVLSKSEILKVKVAYSNIDTSDCSIIGVIRKKDQDGKYNESSNLGQTTITKEGEQDISLNSTNGAGSYCLWITVSKKNQTILEVPYYFIIQE